jgi:hypothetical protein
MNLPALPSRLRRRASLRDSVSVALGGAMMALAMVYGCSSEMSPHPPPGGGECTGHCSAFVAAGGSQVSSGGARSDNDGGGGTFADVNPPPFDGNLFPSVD